MKTFESGRESSILQDIKNGTKTIECRLNRGKFAKYQPGDHVWIREDFYEDGAIIKSLPRQLEVMIEKVEKYPDFRNMFETIGYERAIPRAASIDEALRICHQFYAHVQEREFGVLAIYFKVLPKV